MRIAIVHDWLDTWGGSEVALAEILAIYPEADLYTLVDFMAPETRSRLPVQPAFTSFIARLPFARRHFRRYLPLFPRAIESFDLRGYDLVMSSSHAVAKGARTLASQLHICYCYSPMRYAWDMRDQYLAQTGLDRGVAGMALRQMLERLRDWDRATSERVDHFVAISHHIAQRIERCYARTSTVIYPPVPPPARGDRIEQGRGYVTLSRLVPYKRVDLIVKAFRDLPDRSLVVIGDGPERERIAALAGPNVTFTGRVSDGERDLLLASARAFVFAAEEDFGIAPLEAQAHGIPVIALARGGAAETIAGLASDMPTGVLFSDQSPEGVAAAIRVFETNAARITASACRANAQRFAPERFRREFADFVAARWSDFASRRKRQ